METQKRSGINKLIVILMISAFGVSFVKAPVYAFGKPIWEIVYVEDAFGDRTEEFFLANRKPFSGSYNNASTTKGKLKADIVIQRDEEEIDGYTILYIGGKTQLKNDSVDDVYYNITVKRADGNKFETVGVMESSSDRIQIFEANELADALSEEEGKISIYLEQEEQNLNNYLFDASCDNFGQLYEQEILMPLFEDHYQYAEKLFQEKKYDEAEMEFSSLEDYKDSKKRVEEVHEAKLSDAYSNAEKLLEEGNYEEAKTAFLSLKDYKDSAERVSEIEERQNAEEYDMAESLFTSKKYNEAREAYEELGNYKDSAEKVKLCTYQYADSLVKDGFYVDAIKEYEKVKDYQDSEEKILQARRLLEEAYSDCLDLAYQAAEENLLDAKQYLDTLPKDYEAANELRSIYEKYSPYAGVKILNIYSEEYEINSVFRLLSSNELKWSALKTDGEPVKYITDTLGIEKETVVDDLSITIENENYEGETTSTQVDFLDDGSNKIVITIPNDLREGEYITFTAS